MTAVSSLREMIVGREIECGVFGDGDSTKAPDG